MELYHKFMVAQKKSYYLKQVWSIYTKHNIHRTRKGTSPFHSFITPDTTIQEKRFTHNWVMRHVLHKGI